MSNGVAKIKESAARLGARATAVAQRFKARKPAAGPRSKRDRTQLQFKIFLYLLVGLVWTGLAKLTQDIFQPKTPETSLAKDSMIEQLKGQALYPWAKGYTRGHDIVEPEVHEDRGLAAAIDSRDLKVTVGARYVEFKDIEAIVKAGMGNHSRLLVSITFEVDSYPSEQEVLAKEMKIREIVASILATKDKGVLQNFKGVASFKNELLKRLTLVIRTGRVTDILITT